MLVLGASAGGPSLRHMAFTERWTQDQRDAVIAAALDHNLTAPRVTELAAAGGLPGPGAILEPFAMPLGTVRSVVGDARRERKARELAAMAPNEVLGDIVGTLAAELRRQTELFRRRSARGKAGAREMRELAVAARELAALVRAVQPPASSGKKRAGESRDAPGRDFLEQLAADEQRNGA